MKGGRIHNQRLLEPTEFGFCRLGALVRREYPLRPRGRGGSVDLLVRYGLYRIVVEGEMGPDRVWRDVEKAVALQADLLLIVVPNERVRGAIQRRLDRLPTSSVPPSLKVCCLTVGGVLRLLANKSLFDVSLERLKDIKTFERKGARCVRP